MRASSTERFLASLSRRRILSEMETQPASVPVSVRETEQDVEEEEESPERTSETVAQQQLRDKIQATINRVNASQVLDGEFADPLEEKRGEMATLAQVLFFFSIQPRGIFLSHQSLGFRNWIVVTEEEESDPCVLAVESQSKKTGLMLFAIESKFMFCNLILIEYRSDLGAPDFLLSSFSLFFWVCVGWIAAAKA